MSKFSFYTSSPEVEVESSGMEIESRSESIDSVDNTDGEEQDVVDNGLESGVSESSSGSSFESNDTSIVEEEVVADVEVVSFPDEVDMDTEVVEHETNTAVSKDDDEQQEEKNTDCNTAANNVSAEEYVTCDEEEVAIVKSNSNMSEAVSSQGEPSDATDEANDDTVPSIEFTSSTDSTSSAVADDISNLMLDRIAAIDNIRNLLENELQHDNDLIVNFTEKVIALEQNVVQLESKNWWIVIMRILHVSLS